MKYLFLASTMTIVLLMFFPPAWAYRELTDKEMGEITAGGISIDVANGGLNFQFGEDRGRFSVSGDGTIQVRENPLSGETGVLILRDNAQGNLKSFINVNAVNSAVQVLINLNININSTVGVLRQLNSSRSF